MATIRDVIQALAKREGIEAVVVLGEDGLPIDAITNGSVDAENLAALVPPVVSGCGELGHAANRGEFQLSVLEYGHGMAIVTVLSAQAVLVILTAGNTNIGSLLYDLHRFRTAIAALF